MNTVFAVVLLLAVATQAVSIEKVQQGSQIAAFQSSSIYKALHNKAALANALEYVYSPEDQMMIISSFAQVDDSVLHTFSSKENVAAFRKTLTKWSFPSWNDIKTSVGDWWKNKKEEVANTWAKMKEILSDLGNAKWCTLCDKATTAISAHITETLDLAWSNPTEAVCNVVDWLFEKGCGAILTPVLTTAITAALPVVGAVGPKVADGICWVLGKANSYACNHLDGYGKAIATKIASAIPAAAGSAAKAFVDAVKAEVATYVGKEGKICKDWMGVCPGDL